MGKVLDRLAALPSVKTLNVGPDGISIVLADGYANEGAVETIVQTAHAARLWIQAASNGREGPKRKARPLTVATENGDLIQSPDMEMFTMKGYYGGPYLPLQQRSKDFCASSFQGRYAYLNGFALKSHGWGQTSAGKNFEAAWLSVQRQCQQDAEDRARRAPRVVEATPTTVEIEFEKAA